MNNPLVTFTFQKGTRESIEAFVAFVERTPGRPPHLARDERRPAAPNLGR